LLVLRSIFTGIANSVWAYALGMIPISECQTLILTFPFGVGIFAYYFLGEKYQLLDFICLVISFFGIILIAKPEALFKLFSSHISAETILYEHREMGIFLSLLIAFLWSLDSIVLRKLKNTSNVFT